VERDHGLDQDRPVSDKIRGITLAGISTIEEANRFLVETYLPKMTSTFSRPAAETACFLLYSYKTLFIHVIEEPFYGTML
jgi:hypothetical protein